MVRMGMSVIYNPDTGESTKWEEAQLYSNLQDTIGKHTKLSLFVKEMENGRSQVESWRTRVNVSSWSLLLTLFGMWIPKDNHGISYTRKAMVRMGMSLNYNPDRGESTKWEEAQLFSNLQEIIAKLEPTLMANQFSRISLVWKFFRIFFVCQCLVLCLKFWLRSDISSHVL